MIRDCGNATKIEKKKKKKGIFIRAAEHVRTLLSLTRLKGFDLGFAKIDIWRWDHARRLPRFCSRKAPRIFNSRGVLNFEAFRIRELGNSNDADRKTENSRFSTLKFRASARKKIDIIECDQASVTWNFDRFNLKVWTFEYLNERI